MLPNEMERFHDLSARSGCIKYWMPLVWARSIVGRARNENIIRDDLVVKSLLDELCAFRTKCDALIRYDWVAVPLVYSKVMKRRKRPNMERIVSCN